MIIPTLLPLALLLVQPALSAYTTTNTSTPHDNSEKCDCYVTNTGADSKTPEYFQYHRFFDFSNLADKPGQYLEKPPLVTNTQNKGEESVWNEYILNSDEFNTDWSIQGWGKKSTKEFPVRMVNSPANVYISQNDDPKDFFTWLTLRTSKLNRFQSASEMENLQKNLKHCSMRMLARVVGDKGAVAGFFTYFDDDNESDIEILTRDPTDKIRYTNQPALDDDGNEVAEASHAVAKLPAWNEWQTHRIDWLPKNSYWFLNDKQVAASTYSVPRESSYAVLNMWSDGGEWSGNMSVGASSELQIQWIEMIFNTSGPVEGVQDPNEESKRSVDLLEKREEKGCKVVCKVDGVKTVGTPEVAGAAGLSVSWGPLVVVGCVSLILGV